MVLLVLVLAVMETDGTEADDDVTVCYHVKYGDNDNCAGDGDATAAACAAAANAFA